MKPSREQAEEAIRTILKWLGEDHTREGLVDTPKRIIDRFSENFSGYEQDPGEILSTTFSDIAEYDSPIIFRNIEFCSFCEHHILPVRGNMDIAYVPDGRVVGMSKIVRLVNIYTKRLQIQERLTVQIADAIEKYLAPLGTAVIIRAKHDCMATRGVKQSNIEVTTSVFRGVLASDRNSIKNSL